MHSTKHETSTNSSLCDDKTAYSTPHYRRSQSVDGVHPGGEESFQRTLAVKQQPGVSRRPPVGGSSPRKNTDFMIFFLNVTERSCSILDQWLLRTVPQGKEESRFFSFISTERLWVSSEFDLETAASQGVVMGRLDEKKILRPRVWNECCGLSLEITMQIQNIRLF